MYSIEATSKEKLQSKFENEVRGITTGDWSSQHSSLHSEANSTAYLALKIQQRTLQCTKCSFIYSSLLPEADPLADVPLI